jgi:hypothetical protein
MGSGSVPAASPCKTVTDLWVKHGEFVEYLNDSPLLKKNYFPWSKLIHEYESKPIVGSNNCPTLIYERNFVIHSSQTFLLHDKYRYDSTMIKHGCRPNVKHT